MAKNRSSFICQSCAAVSTQWAGRCEACGEWNSIIEELQNTGVGSGPKATKASGKP
ncbi:MAG: DNA repair protein RadA, partial [Devosiaceae bacterium]|nr:DNA repair protein RadA [Devosiaceae bacterium]